ncbi:MAG: DNA repair protein RecO, partial [Deltaproteobacteria bacterium]|nr:DNA repair protein RecO [Deltaproteobacteria bacterium]
MDLRADRVEALVLRTVPYGESDLVVHLLVRERGRLSAFARAGQKSKRFAGALEPFSLIETLLAERPGADLVTLREATLREGFGGLREDLHRIAHAGFAVELAHELSRAGQPAEAVFDGLRDFLSVLSTGAATSARVRALELALLLGSGLAPELDSCARCGAEVPAGRAFFDAASGGLLDERC